MCLVIILLFTHIETLGFGFAVWRPTYFTGQLKVLVLVITFLETKKDMALPDQIQKERKRITRLQKNWAAVFLRTNFSLLTSHKYL